MKDKAEGGRRKELISSTPTGCGPWVFRSDEWSGYYVPAQSGTFVPVARMFQGQKHPAKVAILHWE